nr:MAG TPA: hypothetical protein [Caudoviricetes sp.]
MALIMMVELQALLVEILFMMEVAYNGYRL